MERTKLTKEQRERAKLIRDSHAKIEKQKAQKHVKRIDIGIEWRKSTYGLSPVANARVWFADDSFEISKDYRAGGWGYDKESTVVAKIFNDYLAYKLHQVEHKEGRPYGISYDEHEDGFKSCNYDKAIGVECYYKISQFIDGELEKTGTGKSFDCYRYNDNLLTQSQEG